MSRRCLAIGSSYSLGSTIGISRQTLWAGKAQLEYRPSISLLLYAGVNRGVKAGSYNAALAGGLAIPVSAVPYKAEVLTSFEGGFKYTFPDGRTRVNAAAYYYDYKDYQAFLFTGVSGVVINADDTTYGGEIDVFTSPIDGLDVGLAASWFDAKVKNVPMRVNGPIVRDVRPVYAPRLQATAILRYGWEALRGRFSVGGDASYTSSFYYNLRNFSADRFGRVAMVNANMSYAFDGYDFTLGIRNLTNVHAGEQGFEIGGLAVEAAAGPGARPVDRTRARIHIAAFGGVGARFVGVDILKAVIERGFGGDAVLQCLVEPFGPGFGGDRRGVARILGAAGRLAFQQRVPLQLVLDIGLKLEIGKLQQLDRLLQLRGHHQGLTLAHLQARDHRHGWRLSDACGRRRDMARTLPYRV